MKLTYDTIIESVMRRTKRITDAQQKAAAKVFAEFWKGKGCEKGECQKGLAVPVSEGSRGGTSPRVHLPYAKAGEEARHEYG